MKKSTYLLILGFCLILTSYDYMDAPPPSINPYMNGVFTETAPGEVGSWQLVDAYPEIKIASPLRMIPFPNSEDYLVLSKLGIVYRVNLESQESTVVLDITDRSFKLGEAGTTSIVLHPEFGNTSAPDKQLIFVFYRHKPDPDKWSEKGFNRLSKFSWNAQSQTFDPSTEEILIQQYDRSTWHNGGGMFFGPEGYLHLSLGDEGFEDHQTTSTQRLDLSLFSGVIRIDIDNDTSRSHPIIRQPLSIWESEWLTDSWVDNFSQGYSIPNDNPWLSPDGSHLEEFYAIGTRSPYSTYYDEMENRIWVLDVGSDKREEVNKVSKGDNLQWPYKEGTFTSEVHTQPTTIIGNEKEPVFEYERSVGTCIIGGGIYRGDKFPSLFGQLLLSDFSRGKLMSLSVTEGEVPQLNTLIADIRSANVELPTKPGIAGIHILDNGDILFTVIGEDHTETGKILKLKQNVILADPPSKLSELGAFKSLETLEPADGIIPYSVNAPLWSDRAIKKRWMAIPASNNEAPIKYSENGNWDFPEGTVFIKHFELPLTTDESGPTARLETRFFVIGKDKTGYGLTYQWNDEGTEAFLLRIGDKKTFDITESGEVSFTQTWDYPSRDQCISCHNANAEYVLGVNTKQLNGTQYYHDTGMEMNQLEYLSANAYINKNITDATTLPTHYNLHDNSANLEARIRSYLDSNCASCHRAGGVPDVNMDLRSNIPLTLNGTINAPAQSLASTKDGLIIKPGNHAASELWLRDASDEDNMMPPLARNLIDQTYVDLLAEWIDGLDEDAGDYDKFILFPNPSSGNFTLRFSDKWTSIIDIEIYASNGTLVLKESHNSNIIAMQLSELAAGTYILKANSGDEELVERFAIY